MGRHLVLVGGGHAHLTTLLGIDRFVSRGHRVTVVSPSPYHYYSGMGPGMLAGTYNPSEIRFNIRKMTEERGASFIEDEAVAVDPVGRTVLLGSGAAIPYDVASFAVGSGVPTPPGMRDRKAIFPVKPIVNLYHARHFLLREIEQRPLDLVVIGGGPAGVEIAANLSQLLRDRVHRAGITLVERERILDGASERVRSLARQSLAAKHIRVREGARGTVAEGGGVLLTDGTRLACDVAFLSTGVRPPSLFRDASLPVANDGSLLVNRYLQNVAHPELFGGGDCISLENHSLAKVGVHAVRQNPVLFHNLQAALEGNELRAFNPARTYLLILNMGDGRGILWRKRIAFDGRIPFLLKDWIDRRFMSRFQVSRERDEPGAD
jgi:NADH dehydrogenase FAD-containing subunit